MRVNLGCGQAYMDGWVNVDASVDVKADVYMEAAEFARQYGPEMEEVYLGHVIEHLMPADALATLTMLNERMQPGAVISAVTPDMAAITKAYQAGRLTNFELNAEFVYSYVQPSHHVWCHDTRSLTDLFQRAGIGAVEEIDPLSWAPVYHKSGRESQWQCGVKGRATGRPTDVVVVEFESAGPERPRAAALPTTAEELLLAQVRRLREQAVRQARQRMELERQIASQAGGAGGSRSAVGPTAAPTLDGPEVAAEASLPDTPTSGGLPGLIEKLAPAGSERRAHVRAAAVAAHQAGGLARTNGQVVRNIAAGYRQTLGAVSERPDTYRAWAERHDTPEAVLRAQSDVCRRAVEPTSYTIVVTDAGGDLDRTLDSLVAQSWIHWKAEICGTRAPRAARQDGRWGYRGGVGANLVEMVNAAVSQTEADFVMFLEAGDVLAPDCLYHLHVAFWSDPLVDLVVFDDDRLDETGARTDPRFRPSWSPDTLLGANYIGRAFALRWDRFMLVAGLRSGTGTAHLWDLLLRSEIVADRTTRVPRILAHLGTRPDSVDSDGVAAVTAFLAGSGRPADVSAAGDVTRIRWEKDIWPTVSIVIPTRHNRAMLGRLLGSMAKTAYAGRYDLTIMDNGARTADNESWYGQWAGLLELKVSWWDAPFNYSAVNNRGAADTTGEVLVFLNDDMEVLDPEWLTELVGWATQAGIGVAGLQLTGADGRIQHAGATLGMHGFADHVFEGMPRHSPSLLGPTDWYRNVLAVTGACLAVRREIFEVLGGFDEGFVLCGSDVTLGLDAAIAGLRSVCSPHAGLLHLESATRGTAVPPADFFASYWRYNPWLFGGDPYFSPNLSLEQRTPTLRPADERSPGDRLAEPLGRPFHVFRQRDSADEARALADLCRFRPADAERVRDQHARIEGRHPVQTINWFIPEIDSPFYGGINTALRLAAHLAEFHGVENRFIVWGGGPEPFVRSALAAAFPSLGRARIVFVSDMSEAQLAEVPPADAAIATLWVTAYFAALAPAQRRRYYLVQDFEPMFYPASTQYALAEETYRLGLYGLCNTDNLARLYRAEYGGVATSFMPAVDPRVFHAKGRVDRVPGSPVTVFVYARPGHWRNCWEMASLALEELKARLGRKVRIVTAGAWAVPDAGVGGMRHLGLLDYRATGELYRTCDVGLALTLSKHPSYLPLELMACGVPIVAFDNPWGHWILKDGENCLLADRTVDDLVDQLDRLVSEPPLRQRLAGRALLDIAAGHGDWATAFSGCYEALCDPAGEGLRQAAESARMGAVASAAMPIP